MGQAIYDAIKALLDGAMLALSIYHAGNKEERTSNEESDTQNK